MKKIINWVIKIIRKPHIFFGLFLSVPCICATISFNSIEWLFILGIAYICMWIIDTGFHY